MGRARMALDTPLRRWQFALLGQQGGRLLCASARLGLREFTCWIVRGRLGLADLASARPRSNRTMVSCGSILSPSGSSRRGAGARPVYSNSIFVDGVMLFPQMDVWSR